MKTPVRPRDMIHKLLTALEEVTARHNNWIRAAPRPRPNKLPPSHALRGRAAIQCKLCLSSSCLSICL